MGMMVTKKQSSVHLVWFKRDLRWIGIRRDVKETLNVQEVLEDSKTLMKE